MGEGKSYVIDVEKHTECHLRRTVRPAASFSNRVTGRRQIEPTKSVATRVMDAAGDGPPLAREASVRSCPIGVETSWYVTRTECIAKCRGQHPPGRGFQGASMRHGVESVGEVEAKKYLPFRFA